MSKKIIAIDDSPPIPKAIKIILSKEGFDVIEAYDGEEGYQKIVETKPDLIISDVGLPKLNGYELFEKVKANTDISSIPFIFLTGQTSERREDLPADGWITKPFNKQSILDAVKAVLKI